MPAALSPFSILEEKIKQNSPIRCHPATHIIGPPAIRRLQTFISTPEFKSSQTGQIFPAANDISVSEASGKGEVAHSRIICRMNWPQERLATLPAQATETRVDNLPDARLKVQLPESRRPIIVFNPFHALGNTLGRVDERVPKNDYASLRSTANFNFLKPGGSRFECRGNPIM